MAKVKVELGGEFTGAQAFQQVQANLKKVGQAHKDMASVATKSLNVISSELGGMGKAAGAAGGVIQGLVTGGMWGALASAAATVIGRIAEWFKEARKNAEELEKSIRLRLTNSIKDMANAISSVGDNARESTKDIDDMVKLGQGQIANNTRLKVAEVSTQALQKMTDDMTQAGRNVIKAQGDIEVQSVKYAGVLEQLDAELKGLKVKQSNLGIAYEQASRMVSQMEENRAQFLAQNGAIIARYSEVTREAGRSLEEMIAITGDERKAREWLLGYRQLQKQMEQEHGDVLKADIESQKNLTTAKEEQERILKDRESLDRQLNDVMDKQKIAAAENNLAETELAQKLREAQAAHAKETEAANALAEAERKKKEEEEARQRAEEARKKAQLEQIGAEVREREAVQGAQINQLNQVQNQIDALNGAINRGNQAIENWNRGMETDRRVAGGWDGNSPYQYQSLDENGILVDPVEQDRADRYAGRATRERQNRDKDYYTVGNEERADKIRNDIANGNASEKDQKWLGNYEQKQQQAQQRADELQKKKDSGKRLSNKEQQELDRFNKNKDAVDRAKNQEKLKKAEDDKQALIGNIKTNTDAIKTLLEQATKLR